MNLTLKIVDSHNFNPQGSNIKEFHQKGGSIGRAPNNDFVLVDQEKSVSKLHAFIHYRDGQYYLTDVSTNGVFFNEEELPVAQTVENPRIIHEGDYIRMGTYLLTANLEEDPESIIQGLRAEKESDHNADIEALLSGGDSLLLPKEHENFNNRYDGRFGGYELHNKLGIENTAREAKHVAGDLSIDDFLNQGFDIKNIPDEDPSDLLDLDEFVAAATNPVTTESKDLKAQRIMELTQQLLHADEAESRQILAEIHRLSQ